MIRPMKQSEPPKLPPKPATTPIFKRPTTHRRDYGDLIDEAYERARYYRDVEREDAQ